MADVGAPLVRMKKDDGGAGEQADAGGGSLEMCLYGRAEMRSTDSSSCARA